MAKEKYIIQAELDTKGVLKNARDAQREINNIGRLARETNKNAQITGSVTMKDKGIKETQRALDLAKKNVDSLTSALANAKMSGATQKQVQALESQLVKAQTQATRLSTELSKIGENGKTGFMSGAIDKVKSAGSSMLGTFSKVGNIVSGISAGFNLVSGAVSTATGYVGGFANRLMDTYDAQVQAQKTLSATLKDGDDGYKRFNSHIESGNALIKSQKNDLNELGATLSGYVSLTGEEAFNIVNSINAVGDSLGLNMDTQKQFSYGLAQALGSGALHAQDFNQIMQSALGAQFRDMLIQAYNEINHTNIGLAEFKQAMADGAIDTNVMNRALELFQQKGNELMSSGPSTWGQIREMIANGFNTSALDGFRKGLGDTGIDMSNLGNNATEMASVIGSQLGQMAGKAVGALTQIIDKNHDGKVSQDEMKDAVNDAKSAVNNFFNKINYTSIASFLGKLGSAIGELRRLYNWANDAWGAVQNVLNASRNIGGNTGLLGKALGFRSSSTWGDIFSDFHWLTSNIDPLGTKEPTGLGQKLLGSRNGKLPLDLQFFAGGREAIGRAVEATQPYARASKGATAQPSIGTQDNSKQDIKIIVQSNRDGRRIAQEIYNKLERNGVRLDKR
nr:MAG TPA: hypothetical protein [Caudoviricetes sp.]